MKKLKYPTEGSREYDSLLERYKNIFNENLLDSPNDNSTKKGLETRWSEWKKQYNGIAITESVEDLLVADVKTIKNVWQKFQNIGIPQKELKEGKIRLTRSQALIELDKIFTYTDGYDSKIAQFFIQEADLLEITTCYYCEMAYINTFVSGKRNRRQFDIDHFIPKEICPIFALSLFNFVPSCQVCNSRIKSTRVYFDTDNLVRLSPVSKDYHFDLNVKIHLRPITLRATKEKSDQYYMHFHSQNGYEREVNFFHLEERYEFHKREAIRLKELKERYPESARKVMGKLLHRTEADIYEDLFCSKYYQENGRAFSKLHRDILLNS